MSETTLKKFRAEVRAAVAEYISTEGCSCCQDRDGHAAALTRLGKLLKAKKYEDGSGYDFYRYRRAAHPDGGSRNE